MTTSWLQAVGSPGSTRPRRRLVVVISGASAGVGRGTAAAFARRGWSVALLARDRRGLEAAKREVEQAGGRALVLPVDVADPDAIATAADQAVATWGGIDVWINDAMAMIIG
jgi:NADP-dependent 3-hydroxy acid dehydrogenase YdfG